MKLKLTDLNNLLEQQAQPKAKTIKEAAAKLNGTDFNIRDLWALLGKALQEAILKVKGLFGRAIWVHFAVSDDGNLIITITIGRNGPRIHHQTLEGPEAVAILEQIHSGNFDGLRKRSRLSALEPTTETLADIGLNDLKEKA